MLGIRYHNVTHQFEVGGKEVELEVGTAHVI